MAPGATHNWVSGLYSWGDVVTLTAHAVVGDPGALVRELIVENVYSTADTNGQRRVLFNVRNNGAYPIPGYLVGVSVINQ
jgi:hypothetical protein